MLKKTAMEFRLGIKWLLIYHFILLAARPSRVTFVGNKYELSDHLRGQI
jgi:hypothetical protein